MSVTFSGRRQWLTAAESTACVSTGISDLVSSVCVRWNYVMLEIMVLLQVGCFTLQVPRSRVHTCTYTDIHKYAYNMYVCMYI